MFFAPKRNFVKHKAFRQELKRVHSAEHRAFCETSRHMAHTDPSYKSYRTYKSYFTANSIGFVLCAMHMEKAMHMVHGGKPYFSPHGPPFRPCVIWRPAARNAFLRLPRSPRRLRQRGGLNARCHSASQNIFCDVAAFAAIPSLGPCALGTHGLAPCVRVAQECSTRY